MGNLFSFLPDFSLWQWALTGTAVAIGGFLCWMGVFRTIRFTERKFQACKIVYKDHQGPMTEL